MKYHSLERVCLCCNSPARAARAHKRYASYTSCALQHQLTLRHWPEARGPSARGACRPATEIAAASNAPGAHPLGACQGGRDAYKGGAAGAGSGEGPGTSAAPRHRVTILNRAAGQEVEVDVPEDRWAVVLAACLRGSPVAARESGGCDEGQKGRGHARGTGAPSCLAAWLRADVQGLLCGLGAGMAHLQHVGGVGRAR